jgi:hypothetical protein
MSQDIVFLLGGKLGLKDKTKVILSIPDNDNHKEPELTPSEQELYNIILDNPNISIEPVFRSF